MFVATVGIVSCLSAGEPGGSAAGKIVLVDSGQARSVIAIPARAGETVRYAAKELSDYLHQISGARVPVVEQAGQRGSARIAVGVRPPQAITRNVTKVGNPESILIHADEKGLVLTGGSDRGTLYAVYRFLETALGCRWLAPGGVEVVPKRKTVAVEPMHVETSPAFDLRTFKCGPDADQMDWALKVGLNGFYAAKAAKRAGGAYYLPEQLPGCHTWYRVVPPAKYFETHPEWFALIDGQRRPGKLHGTQLCVTAPGLVDEFARNIIRLFDRDPQLEITSISPNDGYGWCECEGCEALDRKLCKARMTKQGLSNARRFRGDRVFWFANEVARRVAKKHPDKKLLVLAYVNYAEPPDTIRPLPNVVPWLCHYAPADYAKPIADASSAPNRQFNALLKAWAKTAPHLLYYGYVSKSMWWDLPRPVTRNFAADVKHLHALGVHRYYAQSRLSNWPLDGPLYYVLAKLMWDPTLDPERLAADWVEHMFGAAAPEMARFYQAVEDAVRKTGRPYSDNPLRDVPGLYAVDDLDRARDALARAAAKASDATIRERVGRVTETFLYGYQLVRAIEALQRFKEGGESADLAKARKHGTEALRHRRLSKAVSFVRSIESFTDLGVLAKGFGKAETLGGRRCWNSDETGLGDGRSGWATFYVKVADPTKPVRVEMDVWGESHLGRIVIQRRRGEWKGIRPESALSGKAKWETVGYTIPPDLMAPDRRLQEIGFGGGDSQVWIASIRVKPLGRR